MIGITMVWKLYFFQKENEALTRGRWERLWFQEEVHAFWLVPNIPTYLSRTALYSWLDDEIKRNVQQHPSKIHLEQNVHSCVHQECIGLFLILFLAKNNISRLQSPALLYLPCIPYLTFNNNSSSDFCHSWRILIKHICE